ncbi:MAG: BamA/TamA family outer membrane protein [Flavobacteriales bacterium]|nr:BamA/TamA family outer membrane protein [Flavobacteriales bacterium]
MRTMKVFPLAIAGCMLLLSACTGMKYATEEKPLFTGFTVEWTEPPVKDKKAITHELENLVKPAPNNSIFGLRPTVALHNSVKEPKKTKSFANLLRNKIGSAPVYLADVPVADIKGAIVNRLNNHGYFGAVSDFTIERNKRKATITFTASAGTPDRIRSIAYADSSDALNKQIALSRKGSDVKPGDLYDLGALKVERLRVTGRLRNKGWWLLKDDDLEFTADTSVGGHLLDLGLRVKSTTEEKVLRRYFIGDIYVHGDHDALLTPNDTVRVDSLYYINTLNSFRPSTITRGVFLGKGKHYSERNENTTVRYLSSYGVFKSVNVEYTEDSLKPGVLKTDVLLTPMKRWTLFTELNAIAKSNNFVGPGLRTGFKDRDVFRGAEIFTADLNGRFETQVAGAQKGTNAYELGAKTALQFPRIVPFHFFRTARASVPTTRIELGYGIFRRINLYGLESFNTSLNYNWKQNPRVWHEVNLIDVSYNKLYYSSDDFTAFLNDNPAVQRSFEQQFIVGAGYTFTISSKHTKYLQGWVLASFGVDESGNLPSALLRSSGPRPDDGYKLFGTTFSQYVRFRPEVRYYQPLGPRGAQMASRVQVNFGLPYGNSEVLPYVKQFFSGGTNSLRAFRARAVGPGSFLASDSSSAILTDQTGDIKFEINSEYRFTIAGYFKGALFADAGNIWLVNPDPKRPGGVFKWPDALDEMALGAGFGLRFDPQVIVVRLDLATPLRDPSLPKGDRWVFDDLKPKFFDNVIFNIAIGYPF